MLRELGKRVDSKILLDFLNQNKERMARTALRYAIEHLPEKERQGYLRR
jgi:3-methyladenine DNA glycosylase AlkD